MGDLFLQAKYAPENKRLLQISACETLIRLIHPGMAYPFDFICFHLTGYRPRGGETDNALVPYEKLLSDLAIYTESLSKTLTIRHSELGQKVYSIEGLSRRFRVCSKTIGRWRRSGLLGRYVIFPNGRQSLGFLASTVDYFIAQNRKKVRAGRQFNHLTEPERDAIINRLIRWSYFCPNHRQEAVLRTSRKFGRALETVRLILQAYNESTHEPLFLKRSSKLSEQEQQEICLLYGEGRSVPQLMQQFNRSRSNIYWAINRARARRLKALDLHFMASDEFATSHDQRIRLLTPSEDINALGNSVTALQKVSPPAGTLESVSAYMRDISQWPLLNAREELFLFRKYNYLKYLAAATQAHINPNYPEARILKEMDGYLQQAEETRDLLVQSNLRLVVSSARKHTQNYTEMLELIGEGNVILLNAVEKYNYQRGVKFSTYGTWALIKRFATLLGKRETETEYLVPQEWIEVTADMRVSDSKVQAIETARKSLQDILAENLEEREQLVVREHYGLATFFEGPGKRVAKSFNKIGEVMGLSKERVRQIELSALNKLRKVLTREQFDYLIQS
jgi:RNA polymerase sigma factor (sigma-70 family)